MLLALPENRNGFPAIFMLDDDGNRRWARECAACWVKKLHEDVHERRQTATDYIRLVEYFTQWHAVYRYNLINMLNLKLYY